MRIYPHPPHRQHISAHPTHSSQTPPRNHLHPPSFRHKNARLWLISPSIPMIPNPPMLLLQQLRARGHGRHWRQSPPTTTRRCMRPPRKYLSSRSSSQHRCVSLAKRRPFLARPSLRLRPCFFPPKPQKSRSPFVTAAPVVVAAATALQHSVVPAPIAARLGVASMSASISPSPFAPPPASAPITGVPPLPLPSSHLIVKAKSPDVVLVPAPSSDLDAREHAVGSEYVMEHTSASTHPDDGGARLGENSTASHHPPNQPQARAQSRQVCLSSRAVLLSACVYAYVSCDRVQCCHPRIPPITPRHLAPPHCARQGPLCSFLPRLRASHTLAPRPALLRKNPSHQRSYPSIRRRHHR